VSSTAPRVQAGSTPARGTDPNTRVVYTEGYIMAEVTSGKNLTVIVLDEWEASALAGMLHYYANDDAIDGEPRLWGLYDALVPTEDD
jgi:hypothetical protein